MAGKTAIVIGIGDGSLSKALHAYERLITIGLPGEQIVELPGRVYRTESPSDAQHIVSETFSAHHHIVAIPAVDFYDQHPIAVDPSSRAAFCKEFYDLLARRPFDLGDDVIDGLQGAFHIAKTAKHLLGSPTPDEMPRLTVPAIAIASGPSLTSHIEQLRALQGKCLLIACDSALEGLLKHGITPHLVTPLERVPELQTESFTRDAYPGIVFAGTPVVHQSIAPRFDRHLFVPGTDYLFLWAGAKQGQLIHYGQSTGTLAVAVAMALTTGDIYLVGHDLAFAGDKSHWAEAPVTIDTGGHTFEVAGNGGPVQTQYWWDVFRREISDFAATRGGIVNVNAMAGVGARIDHTLPGALPKADSLPDFAFPASPPVNEGRLAEFRTRLRTLPSDARRVLVKLSGYRLKATDLDMRALCDSPNRILLSYILRSVMAQYSMELSAGKSERLVIDAMAESMRTALRECLGIFEEMARCA